MRHCGLFDASGRYFSPARSWCGCASQLLDSMLTTEKKSSSLSSASVSARPLQADAVQMATVMPRQRWRDMLHAVKRTLTTSERSRWNQIDIIDARQYARAHRQRFQRTNDFFHAAGKRGRTLSYEAITLQFEGVEWSYMLLPTFLALMIVVLIALVDGRYRKTKRQEEMKAFTKRADFLASVRKESVGMGETELYTTEEGEGDF
ncbi:hypothetical protein C3747_302g53 [Trypanosoma cruzi]|uniref:Transmembrane protein n=2 Tax=Trypanosoma cruzi TaxID=5693 RepID=Q4CYS1_TRYCC|nr:uncharacterized protein Tc00.1047053506417.50 [Trypanosoma cruzi]EAN85422.1 hypothetical protein, conserved [Trypanosoma cruzi]KAF5217358.1 hypothetical protein ECC02_009786 [Trypanosoma cruzi]KAF8285723.1 hypothetical protein TcYC6_0033220 [Trypanosoma cruzi]KAF8285825.1 hypothetical protein TcYC6_0033170 [Trypanosoma cruzi]PWU93160.1 hypothetical protein C3747_302g53 [Trypanosoma cruzi]|eukprot:XP_807273.1 hypothetical protein Tc00.1047053506417.50 [Trypanosoma cruzi strain CL Brener]